MNETDVEQTILAFLRERAGVALPSASANLIETGILDSMMFVNLIVLIEEQFGVVAELDDLEIENFATVGRMARFVVERSPQADRTTAPLRRDDRRALRSAPDRIP